jgi:hypothetical protein
LERGFWWLDLEIGARPDSAWAIDSVEAKVGHAGIGGVHVVSSHLGL